MQNRTAVKCGGNMREKFNTITESTTVKYVESKKNSVSRMKEILNSFRVYRDGFAGIHYQLGEVKDEEGYKKAEEGLSRKRPYPFEPETGMRKRDMTERKLSDRELLEISEDNMEYLRKNYPDFTFSGSFGTQDVKKTRQNENGMDYCNIDYSVNVGIGFKHKDSKDISDGGFSFCLRDYDSKVFYKMADDYLANYNKMVDFPEELIIDEQYYGIVGQLGSYLNGENLALKTSLLTGKIGQQVFSERFTLAHDVSDKETWFHPFWDGDGCTLKNDRLLLIDHGKILTGYASKKDAQKYNILHTGPAYSDNADIPGTGGLNLRIDRSTKTVKELLDGRYAVIPVMSYGGGFNEKGEYTMPVHSSLLFDGEKILGKLPPFTIISNIFDMFGKDFIGVGSDQPVFHDKQILFRVKRGEMK